MGRIRKAYEAKFRRLLQQVKARRLEHGVRRLLARAERAKRQGRIPEAHALEQVWQEVRQKVEGFLAGASAQR